VAFLGDSEQNAEVKRQARQVICACAWAYLGDSGQKKNRPIGEEMEYHIAKAWQVFCACSWAYLGDSGQKKNRPIEEEIEYHMEKAWQVICACAWAYLGDSGQKKNPTNRRRDGMPPKAKSYRQPFSTSANRPSKRMDQSLLNNK
jgi:hypothetical protein